MTKTGLLGIGLMTAVGEVDVDICQVFCRVLFAIVRLFVIIGYNNDMKEINRYSVGNQFFGVGDFEDFGCRIRETLR